MRLQAPKGFKDYIGSEAIQRQIVVDKIKAVFARFGFDPLETPTLEYEETLTGKYGEEEKLIYKFETKGGDKVALKYDQTVPLARVVAQYGPRGQQILPIPFKRYQIQSAYRGENTQKGRYREFLQCDADIVGSETPFADAEILGIVYEVFKELGLEVIIKVNDRSLIADIEPKFLSALDKLNKVGEEGVLKELVERGLAESEAKKLFNRVKDMKMSQNLEDIINIFKIYQTQYEMKDEIQFDPMLIRGLDYYTGLILEVVLKSNPSLSSLGGGGRWDKMIGKFTGIDLPAVGFSFGIDRLIESMIEEGLVDKMPRTNSKVLVTVFSKELADVSYYNVYKLREAGINAEGWLDMEAKLDKQLKYADQKGIPFALIIGPDEYKNKTNILKDLKNKTQETLGIEELFKKLSQE